MSRQSGAAKRDVFRWRHLIPMLLLILIAFFFILRNIQKDYAAVLDAKTQVLKELEITQAEYNSLTIELQQVGSSSYIENVARQNFSFLKPGELRFEISNPDKLDGYTYAEIEILQQERKYK